MRNLAVLVVAATALSCTLNSAQAQNFSNTNNNNRQQDSVVYTLELTEQMIEDLRNGQSLSSKIPPELRNKVSEVRLRMVRSDRTANANNGMRGAADSSVNNPFNNQSGGFQDNRGSDSSGLPQPPANNLLQPRPTTSGVSPNNTPPQRSIPRFDPNRSSFGDPSGNSGFNNNSDFNNSMNSNNAGNNISRHSQPLGPPNPYAAPHPSRNPYANQNRTQLQPPRTNPGGFQPGSPSQPASTQPSGQYNPQQPGNPRMRPSTPSGSEYDTALNRRNGYQDGYRQTPQWNQATQAQQNLQPYQQPPQQQVVPQSGYPEDRFASNQYQDDGWQDRYRNYQESQPGYHPNQPRDVYVPGHDRPQVNQLPRVASNAGYRNDDHASLPHDSLTARIPGNQKSDDGYVATNDGPNGVSNRSPVSQLNQFNSFLYFLLLCSIGLNIYLAWISRGFYVRYRELADELRDTFSTV